MSAKAGEAVARPRAPTGSGAARRDAGAARPGRGGGPGHERGADRLRRLLDPFDVMRSTRALAPHDPKLNDMRWLIGEALRRLHQRAQLDALRAVAPEASARKAFGPRSGLPASETALHARDKLRAAEERAGAAAWPIVTRIVIEGARRARLPRLRAGNRHPLARRRGGRRPPARRARPARRPARGDGEAPVRAGSPGAEEPVFARRQTVKDGGARDRPARSLFALAPRRAAARAREGKYSRRQSSKSIVAKLRRAPVSARIRSRRTMIAPAAIFYSCRVQADCAR